MWKKGVGCTELIPTDEKSVYYLSVFNSYFKVWLKLVSKENLRTRGLLNFFFSYVLGYIMPLGYIRGIWILVKLTHLNKDEGSVLINSVFNLNSKVRFINLKLYISKENVRKRRVFNLFQVLGYIMPMEYTLYCLWWVTRGIWNWVELTHLHINFIVLDSTFKNVLNVRLRFHTWAHGF